MKTSPEDVTILLVGGGSIIAPEEITGVAQIVRPPFFSVANAVGAAMAKGSSKVDCCIAIYSTLLDAVAGEIDTIEILANRKIDEVIEEIKAKAIEKAVKAGANPGKLFHLHNGLSRNNASTDTVRIVEVANLPVQVRYLMFGPSCAIHKQVAVCHESSDEDHSQGCGRVVHRDPG